MLFIFIMYGIFIILVIIGIILKSNENAKEETERYLSGLQKREPAAAPPLPITKEPRYICKESIMSRAEIEFYRVLIKAIPETPIFTKVRVADVIDSKKKFSGDFLKISQKHFDWIVCHPETFQPLIAIELDDSSHDWSTKQRRNDLVKDEVTEEAGLHLIRFKWQKYYSEAHIRNVISNALDEIANEAEAAKAATF